MRLLRGLQLIGRPGTPKGNRDDASIGSTISAGDQFEILVGHKAYSVTTWPPFGSSDETDISSITTEYIQSPIFENGTSSRASGTSSWCCCSNSTDHSALDSENTLVLTKGGLETTWSNCCTDVRDAPTGGKRPTDGSRSAATSIMRTGSLFDILHEEEDDSPEVIHSDKGMTKLRKSLRRALPWGRKQNQQVRAQE